MAKSCYFVETSLIFHPDRLYHCCIPVNGKFGSTLITEYFGGELPMDKIYKSRNKYRKLIDEIELNSSEHCYGCPYITDKADIYASEEYPFQMLHFNTSFLCNLHCNFCVQRSGDLSHQRPKYSMLPIVEQVIEEKLLDPQGYVFWAGGEPTVLPEFNEALQRMVDYGVKNEIATNSTIFSPAIYNALKLGKVSLKTSVDCGTPDDFLRIKGRDMFRNVFQNLSKYASTGADVGAKYIISTDNISDINLRGFVNNITDSNINYVYIDINHNINRNDMSEDMLKAAAFLYDKLKDSRIVHLGVHSYGSFPDFKTVVESYTKHTLATEIDKNAYRQADPSEYFKNQLNRLNEVEPEPLTQASLLNTKVYADRVIAIHTLPKGGRFIEVGTQTGGFAKQVLAAVEPSELHVADIDYSRFDFKYFDKYIKGGKVIVHKGYSWDILDQFENCYFDYIYIDADHSYECVKNDLETSIRKIKPKGIIIMNDYTCFSPLENFCYGVPKAVNHIVNTTDFKVKYIALHPWSYLDIAISRV